VVEDATADGGGVLSHRRVSGIVEDIVTEGYVAVAAPPHDLAAFSIARIGEGESVVGDQIIFGPISKLNRPARLHVVENVVDDGQIGSVAVDAVIKVQDVAAEASDVMPDVAIESEVVLAVVDVDAVPADLIRDVPVADVADFVLLDDDVVSAVVALKAAVTGVLNHEALNHDEAGVVQIPVRSGAVTGAARRVAGVQDGLAPVLSHESNRMARGAGIVQRDDEIGLSHAFVVVGAVHHDNRVVRLRRGRRPLGKVEEGCGLCAGT